MEWSYYHVGTPESSNSSKPEEVRLKMMSIYVGCGGGEKEEEKVLTCVFLKCCSLQAAVENSSIIISG